MLLDLLRGSPAGFEGKGYLAGSGAGIVTVAGVPAVRRLFVYDRASRKQVASARSGADGTWRIDGLDESRKYYVIAFDSQNQFNAVIRDNITPAVDP